MKKHYLLFAFIIFSINSFAQGSAGLVGHWNFNGNANDISGNGLHGVVTGATLAPGYSNIANTAYKFQGAGVSGDVDNIFVGYNSLMNVQTYSICALVKFSDFSAENCQSSTIFWRGQQGNADYYALYANDNPYDLSCATVTKDKNNFLGDQGYAAWALPATSRGYSSYLDTAQWYCVATTFDGDSIRLYINGELYKTLGYSVPLQPSTDAMRFGASMYTTSNYDWLSYPLYGSIDDIRFYSRALNGSEVITYCDSAKGITDGEGGGNNGGGNGGGGGTDWPSSVNSVSNDIAFVVAPNPASNQVQVILQNNTNGEAQLVNTMGQVLAKKVIAGNAVQFDLGTYAPGVYMVRIQANGQTALKKFLKQ